MSKRSIENDEVTPVKKIKTEIFAGDYFDGEVLNERGMAIGEWLFDNNTVRKGLGRWLKDVYGTHTYMKSIPGFKVGERDMWGVIKSLVTLATIFEAYTLTIELDEDDECIPTLYNFYEFDSPLRAVNEYPDEFEGLDAYLKKKEGHRSEDDIYPCEYARWKVEYLSEFADMPKITFAGVPDYEQ